MSYLIGLKASLRNRTNRSPYLSDPSRLGDVIAAIQSLGTYKYYKGSIETWVGRLTGSRRKDFERSDDWAKLVGHWRKVFEEHPEFFRFSFERPSDSDKLEERGVSLVIRRQRPKLYDVDLHQLITKDQYRELSEADKKRVSREPLSSEQLETLLNVAINLHSRAIDRSQDSRWWIAPVFSLVGALAGGILTALTVHGLG